jgi:hypothetical protein
MGDIEKERLLLEGRKTAAAKVFLTEIFPVVWMFLTESIPIVLIFLTGIIPTVLVFFYCDPSYSSGISYPTVLILLTGTIPTILIYYVLKSFILS